MKRLLTISVAFLVTTSLAMVPSLARASDDKLDPVGSWRLRINRPGRPSGGDAFLVLERAGGKLIGVLKDAQGRNAPIKDAQFKDGELTFKVIFEREGQKVIIEYKGKVTEKTMKGKVAFSIFNMSRSFDFEGERGKEDTTLAGLWKITLTMESGEKLQTSVRLKQERNRLTGQYVSLTGKEAPLEEVQLKDGEIAFQAPDKIEEDKGIFHFQGKVTGDTITGTAKFVAGSQSAKAKFEAKKVQTPTANIAGAWKLTMVVKDMPTFTGTLTVAQAGSTLSGTYRGEQGETAITDGLVLADEIGFEVIRERSGKKYKLRFQGRVQGDTIKGNVEYYFDGIAGYADFEGVRAPRGTPSGS